MLRRLRQPSGRDPLGRGKIMEMGFTGCGHHYGQMRPSCGDEGASRGERLVARLDADEDGALGIAELAGSRLGKHMTLDRFARLDTNGDDKLDAAELDSLRRGERGPAGRETAMRAQYAAWLAETVEPAGDDVAGQVIDLLDTDGNGRLNSEEIAGTRLAQIIGGDFYRLDGDRNGALDTAELADFLAERLTAPEEVAATEDTDSGTTSSSAYQQAIQSAFDNALQILSGSSDSAPASVVQSLYAEVRDILHIA